MLNILSFGASSSSTSINQKFAEFTATLISNIYPDTNITIVKIIHYPLPFYSEDLEKEIGIPPNVQSFMQLIYNHDLIIISLAEHNSSYTVVFKNLFDWLSRLNTKLFLGKKLLLLATSPGKRGAVSVLNAAVDRFKHHGDPIIEALSLPNFYENFNETLGLINNEFLAALKQKISFILA